MRQIFKYDPIIGYRYIPGLRARIPHEGGGYLFQVNSSGFRCRHDFTPRKKEGKRRILLFGDSFTAGDGVSDGKRFGDILEELIPDLEVYNFGLPGSGTDQQYLAYREEGDVYKRQPVVISDMPSFVDYERGVLYRASGKEDFVEQIRLAYSEDCSRIREKRLEIAALNTWDKKGDELFALIEEHLK